MTTGEVSLISWSYAREVVCFITYQLVVALAEREHQSSDHTLCMSHGNVVNIELFRSDSGVMPPISKLHAACPHIDKYVYP